MYSVKYLFFCLFIRFQHVCFSFAASLAYVCVCLGVCLVSVSSISFSLSVSSPFLQLSTFFCNSFNTFSSLYFRVTRDYSRFNNTHRHVSFLDFCFVFCFNWSRHVFQFASFTTFMFSLSYTISFTFVIVNIWIVVSVCVLKGFFACSFFVVIIHSAFFRHKLKFICFLFFYMGCNTNE